MGPPGPVLVPETSEYVRNVVISAPSSEVLKTLTRLLVSSATRSIVPASTTAELVAEIVAELECCCSPPPPRGEGRSSSRPAMMSLATVPVAEEGNSTR